MDIDLDNDTFYIVLSSDGSKKYHPKNNPSNFTVQFDTPIELKRKMEVSLMEIIIPPNFAEIKPQKINLMMRNEYITPAFIIQTSEIFFNEIETTEEFYGTLRSQLQINKPLILKELGFMYDESYKDITIGEITPPILEINHNKLKMTKGSMNIRMTRYSNDETVIYPVELHWEFGKELNKITGLGKFPDNARFNIAKRHIRLPLTETFYIFADIIVPSIHNHSKSNLLRVVSKRGNLTNTYVFNPLIFIPLRKNLIESINITIKDDKDNLINFPSRKTFVILLFRPIEHI